MLSDFRVRQRALRRKKRPPLHKPNQGRAMMTLTLRLKQLVELVMQLLQRVL